MKIENTSLNFTRQIRDPRPQKMKYFFSGFCTGLGLIGLYKGVKEYKTYKKFKQQLDCKA